MHCDDYYYNDGVGFLYGLFGFIEVACLLGFLAIGMNTMYKNDVEELGDYKYRISIPQGKYTNSYYAEDYKIGESGAISFTDKNGNKVASPIYTIRTNDYYLEKRGLN